MPTPPDKPPSHQSRFRGLDGVSNEERDQPPSESPSLQRLERDVHKNASAQLDLFALSEAGHFTAATGGLPPLTARSSLELGRTAWRQFLEASRHPVNTIESYSYDLQILENLIGPRQLNRIERVDIATFLGDASSKSTRKRRLTSIRRFFRFLIDDARILKFDPTEGYYPHQIQLRNPVPLFADEQRALLAAAETDEDWSALAIWLMMRLGLTRAELLDLNRDHIDRSAPGAPVVYVVYDDITKQSKDRHLATNDTFARLYDAFLEMRDPTSRLFIVGPQAINGMVDRVRKAASIERSVTPQTLRTTFAVEMARSGADQQTLLAMLGLVNDPRNRGSVDRYIRLATEPFDTEIPDDSDVGSNTSPSTSEPDQ